MRKNTLLLLGVGLFLVVMAVAFWWPMYYGEGPGFELALFVTLIGHYIVSIIVGIAGIVILWKRPMAHSQLIGFLLILLAIAMSMSFFGYYIVPGVNI